MDYYLYSHSNAGGIFYIGKGSNDRKNDYYRSRSKEWEEIAKYGYTTKVEANGTEKDILALEKVVIKSLIEQGVKLVNKFHNKYWDGQRGENNPMFGSFGSKNPMFGRIGEKHPMFGKKHSEESKKQMSESSSGEKSGMFGRENKKACKLANNTRWQKYRFNRANNYGGGR